MRPKDEVLAGWRELGVLEPLEKLAREQPPYDEACRRLDEIKAAGKRRYRELALELHPDRTGGDAEKEARFKQVAVAHEKLGSIEVRRQPTPVPRPAPPPRPQPTPTTVYDGRSGTRPPQSTYRYVHIDYDGFARGGASTNEMPFDNRATGGSSRFSDYDSLHSDLLAEMVRKMEEALRRRSREPFGGFRFRVVPADVKIRPGKTANVVDFDPGVGATFDPKKAWGD